MLKGYCQKKHKKVPEAKVAHYCVRSHCVHLIIQKRKRPVKRNNRKWKKNFETNYG